MIADGEPHEVRADQAVIDAYLGGGPGRRPHERRRRAARPIEPVLTTEELIAGYIPEADILNGVSIDGPRGRDRDHRRPERRRQVDPDQDDLRAAAPALGADPLPRRGDHRAASRTTSPGSGSATCRSSTTCSRASRSRRTWRWARSTARGTDEQIERMYELFPRLGERRAPGRRDDVRRRAPDGRDGPGADARPAGAAARRALGRPRAGLRRRDLREDRGGQPRRA